MGFRKARTTVQREEMDSSLRSGLWNVLHLMLFKNDYFVYGASMYQPTGLDVLTHRGCYESKSVKH